MRLFHLGRAALFATLLPLAVSAQESAQTILVLDASGSMWGQIDGKAKITIAQEVIADLLATLPAEQNLGLTIYGHREKGNCADIETVVAPGPDTRGAIGAAVAGIQPKGKTPMTDAVTAAAEALKYTEERATVILVSDGIETCNPDPCAAAAALEAAGVDFTAHVIGFDVGKDPVAQAQMQCLAQNTGGLFLPADSAAELAEALFTVVDVEPEILPFAVTIAAYLGDADQPLDEVVLWDVSGPDGNVVTGELAAGLQLSLLPGAYTVSGVRIEGEDLAAVGFEVTDQDMSVPVTFTYVAPRATLTAPASAPLGSHAEIAWAGPGEDGDYISVASPDDKTYINYSYTRDGSPLRLQMPPAQGSYEIRYVRESGEVLARQLIDVTPVEVSLHADDTAAAGVDLQVGWTGPGQDLDYISVSKPGDRTYINYSYTREGAPLSLQMPADPGQYELRYVLAQDNTVLATKAITVVALVVALNAPDLAPAGARIDVGWTGPNYDLDYIAVGKPGDRAYINYTYTRDGNPLKLELPVAVGDYEIRYVLAQDNTVLAVRPIVIGEIAVAVSAPAGAPAGSTVSVVWDGPDYDRDYIAVSNPADRSYINYVYTNQGNPAQLVLPAVPGTYEIRYYLNQDSSIAARIDIEVTPVTAKLTPMGDAKVGEKLRVAWEGPGNDRDFIGIGAVGEGGYLTYTYANAGNPLDIAVPQTPGTYELRYFLGQGDTIIARTPLTVGP